MGLSYTLAETYLCLHILGRQDEAEQILPELRELLPTQPPPVQEYVQRALSLVTDRKNRSKSGNVPTSRHLISRIWAKIQQWFTGAGQ